MLRFYDEIPEMTFFAGDTLPAFTIEVEADSLENCTMQMIISRLNPSGNAIISKNCLRTENCFTVQLTSNETKNLKEGTYRIYFVMTDGNGLEYIKLSGLACVRSAGGQNGICL